MPPACSVKWYSLGPQWEGNDIFRPLKHLLLALTYGLLGSMIVVVGAYVYMQEQRPDLKVWHRAELDAEFHAGRADDINSIDDYLQLEEQLFAQLDQQVYAQIDAADRRQINRYARASLSDPGSYPQNWNRTFVLAHDEPVAGAVLLHGLSDSPYSLRALGQQLQLVWTTCPGMILPPLSGLP